MIQYHLGVDLIGKSYHSYILILIDFFDNDEEYIIRKLVRSFSESL